MVVSVFVPEDGPPVVRNEAWDVPFARTEYIFLTDRRATEEELGLLGKHLSRGGAWTHGRWLRRHIDDVRKCEDERDPSLVPLMAYWTVAYDEDALRSGSRARANRALGAAGVTVMGDAYAFLNIERRIGSKTSHIVDADLWPDPVAKVMDVIAREKISRYTGTT